MTKIEKEICVKMLLLLALCTLMAYVLCKAYSFFTLLL